MHLATSKNTTPILRYYILISKYSTSMHQHKIFSYFVNGSSWTARNWSWSSSSSLHVCVCVCVCMCVSRTLTFYFILKFQVWKPQNSEYESLHILCIKILNILKWRTLLSFVTESLLEYQHEIDLMWRCVIKFFLQHLDTKLTYLFFQLPNLMFYNIKQSSDLNLWSYLWDLENNMCKWSKYTW